MKYKLYRWMDDKFFGEFNSVREGVECIKGNDSRLGDTHFFVTPTESYDNVNMHKVKFLYSLVRNRLFIRIR